MSNNEVKNTVFFKNVIWNVSGFIVPIFSALIAIPIIISNIGINRFGVLTLILAMIGFMNVFDFGLTRSITNSIVSYCEKKRFIKVGEVIKTGMVIIFFISVFISVILLYCNDEIVHKVLSVNTELVEEVRLSLVIIGLSLPFVMMQTLSVGILEAFEKFKLISLLRTPFSILMYMLPAIISYYDSSLVYITISLATLRIAMAITFWFIQYYTVNNILSLNYAKSHSVTIAMAIELFRYGGWVSISNIIAPLMLYIDRFFVASILGVGVVAYYTTPFEMISKMSIIAMSVSSVLFPKLVKSLRKDKLDSNILFLKSIAGIAIVLLFPLVIGSFFSKEIISLWINDSFSENAWQVFCLFLFGFFVHGLVQPAYVWIQAEGKPHITAIAHIFDFLLYIIYFPFLTNQFGITGAASAWVLRVSISLVILHLIRYKLYKSDMR